MAKSQKQTGLTRQPIVFYRNSTCPEYSLGETNFIVDNVFTPATVRTIRENAARQAALAQDTSIPEPYRLSPSYYYQDQIARCLIVSESRARYTSEVAKYVVQAVKQFGVDALKLNGFDKYRLDPDPNIMSEKMAKSDAFSRVIEPYIRSAAHESGPRGRGQSVDTEKIAPQEKRPTSIYESIGKSSRRGGVIRVEIQG